MKNLTKVISNKIPFVFGHSEGTSRCCSISELSIIILMLLKIFWGLNVMVVSVWNSVSVQSSESPFTFELFFPVTSQISLLLIAPSM